MKQQQQPRFIETQFGYKKYAMLPNGDRVTPYCDTFEAVRIYTDAYDKGEPVHVYRKAAADDIRRRESLNLGLHGVRDA